jgi:putative tryptophan/tyrosine transport system substrate-binding protein
MLRREFIAGLGSAAVWPPAVRAQQTVRLRRVAIPSNPANPANEAAFLTALARAGWVEGRNAAFDRYGAVDTDARGGIGRIRAEVAGIVARSPDVILCVGTPITSMLKQQTSRIPVVFTSVSDPVVSGLVASFAHPGGNLTGFTAEEPTFAGKWVSLLKDIAPGVRSIMVLYDPGNPNWRGYLRTLEAAAAALGVSISAAPVASIGEIERQIASFAGEPGAGLVVVPTGQTINNREMIAALAARHRLPAMYPRKYFATSGGLASYGSDDTDEWRRAADYVDRILRGEKPGDLPVQAPTKFAFILNLKAAAAIGLEVPASVQLQADEVID